MSKIMYVNNALSGVDSYVVALLHMNGADASTTFTDEAGKSYTASGNAQIDTAQSKFGGASGLFDGTGDLLSVADSADWQLDGGSNSNKWTIDFWVRFASDPSSAAQGYLSQYVDVDNFWGLQQTATDNMQFTVRSGAANIVVINNAWNPAINTWYHVAVVKDGTNGYMMFVDGTQIGTTQTDVDTIPNFAASLRVGRYTNTAGTNLDLNGWLDELRISKGVARWTANFTPPTGEY